jgi:hypothetical protein
VNKALEKGCKTRRVIHGPVEKPGSKENLVVFPTIIHRVFHRVIHSSF